MGCVTSFFRVQAGSRLRRQTALTLALGAALAVSGQANQPDAGPVIQMLREHRNPEALAAADQMLAKYPQDCRLLSLQGMALNSMQKPADAERSFQEALRFCPDDLLALEGAAEIAYAQRQPVTDRLLLRILKIRPQDPTANAMLASYDRGRGDCQAALPHFEASQQLFASRPTFQEGYAFCLAKTGKYAPAAAAYQAVLDRVPDKTARYNLALVQWKLQDPKGALATLQPELTGDANEMVLALGSRLAEESGDTLLAVKMLRQAILTSPKDPENYLEFAQISFSHQSFQVGIDVINAGLTQLPNSAPLYVARGVLEMQLSHADQAATDFERAHRMEPQLSLAMDALGIVASQQYKEGAALDLFRQQAKLHPNDALLQYLYAEALSEATSEANGTQEAIAAARKSVAIDPGYSPARDLLALLWLRANQPQRALEQAEAALKIQPNDDVALYHEIMARRRLGQTDQIQPLLKQLTTMRSENAQKERASHRYLLQEEPGS